MESLARFVMALIVSLLLLGTALGLFVAWFIQSSLLFGAVIGGALAMFTLWGYVSVRSHIE